MDDTYTHTGTLPAGYVSAEDYMEDQLPIGGWKALIQCHDPRWACDMKETRARSGFFNETLDLDNCGRGSLQLYHVYPALNGTWYPFDFEKVFNARWPFCFARNNVHVAVFACVMYVIVVFGLMRVMKRYKPFKLKTILISWNWLLAIFSAIGSMRTVPHLLYNLSNSGLYYTMCAPAEPAYGSGASGFWTCLFIYSKLPELLDTLWLVLRKKPVIFLHWYHHISVLLYAWLSYAEHSSAGLWFIAMNYSVHAVMYSYYALTAMGIRPPWAFLVTAMQISQMAVGILVCSAVFFYKYVLRQPCFMTDNGYVSGLIMYGSYLFLFLVLAIDRYCAVRPRRKSAPPPAKKEEQPVGKALADKKESEDGNDDTEEQAATSSRTSTPPRSRTRTKTPTRSSRRRNRKQEEEEEEEEVEEEVEEEEEEASPEVVNRRRSTRRRSTRRG